MKSPALLLAGGAFYRYRGRAFSLVADNRFFIDLLMLHKSQRDGRFQPHMEQSGMWGLARDYR
ncbi:hypothetical protein Barb4_01970 [Bacteroidales bacterium Barb4]|nr:hypothetical protein Barb4_01970 [Bacteroidales bacterium Barb4]